MTDRTLTIQVPSCVTEWPDDVADIYREIADEDRRLVAAISPVVQMTWPAGD